MSVEAAEREAPQPQPEHQEPRLEDPTLRKLSKRDYLAIVKRAGKEVGDDTSRRTSPRRLRTTRSCRSLGAAARGGIFALVAGPSAVNSLVTSSTEPSPAQAQSTAQQSLTNLTQNKGTGVSFSDRRRCWPSGRLRGAMQNVMWGLNVAYERDETRGFFRRRIPP